MTENPIPDFRNMPASEFKEHKRLLAHREILEAGRRAEEEALARLQATHEARFRSASLPLADMVKELERRGMTPDAAASLAADLVAGKAKGGGR